MPPQLRLRQLLLLGAILAPGKRTAPAGLRTEGSGQQLICQNDSDYAVLVRQAASRARV